MPSITKKKKQRPSNLLLKQQPTTKKKQPTLLNKQTLIPIIMKAVFHPQNTAFAFFRF